MDALDVKYDLLPRGDALVVAVPGTNPRDALDVIRDLRFLPVWIPRLGPLHAGFGTGGAKTWARIAPILPTDKQIVYTGHSLGGAIALVLAAFHALNRPDKCRVVTFGAPRLSFMNSHFDALVRQADEVTEYRRVLDPVPAVPFPPLYQHPTSGVFVGTPVFPNLIANHDIARYVADVAALDQRTNP